MAESRALAEYAKGGTMPEDRKDQRPFARFLRAMFEGRVTELHICATRIIETGDGRKVAQLASLSVTAGSAQETFELSADSIMTPHIVPTLGLQMDRVDMLVPEPPKPLTIGQKIARTEERDVDTDGS